MSLRKRSVARMPSDTTFSEQEEEEDEDTAEETEEE